MAWRPKFSLRFSMALGFAALIGLLSPTTSFAREPSLHLEAMAKFGMLNGSYSGQAAKGSFTSNGALEIEANLFSSPGLAFAIRSVIATDIATSRTRYFYTGVGQRFFFGPHGFESFAHDQGDSIHIRPKFRYLIGYDMGLAQVLVIPYGAVLGSYATTADGTVSAGVRYTFDKNMAADLTTGIGIGTGIATMNVTTFTTRALLGFVYAF